MRAPPYDNVTRWFSTSFSISSFASRANGHSLKLGRLSGSFGAWMPTSRTSLPSSSTTVSPSITWTTLADVPSVNCSGAGSPALPAAHDGPTQTCSSTRSTVITRSIAQLPPIIFASFFNRPHNAALPRRPPSHNLANSRHHTACPDATPRVVPAYRPLSDRSASGRCGTYPLLG